MTALERARGWFIAPPDAIDEAPSWCARNQPVQADGVQPLGEDLPFPGPEPEAGSRHRGGQPSRAAAHGSAPARHKWRPPVPATPEPVSPAPAAERVGSAAVDATPVAGAHEVTSAAVLGRTGEVEPIAAALALSLRRATRAGTATVALVGAPLPDVAEGGRAARRLGERLEGHGFDVRVRGRLAWVRLDPEEGRLAAAARRLSLVGAPAVLAVCAPRSAATDEALLDCDLLVIVTGDPDGPLARLAASGLTGVPVVVVPPLGRGPARVLARAGIRPTRSVRRLLSAGQEQR